MFFHREPHFVQVQLASVDPLQCCVCRSLAAKSFAGVSGVLRIFQPHCGQVHRIVA